MTQPSSPLSSPLPLNTNQKKDETHAQSAAPTNNVKSKEIQSEAVEEFDDSVSYWTFYSLRCIVKI